MHLYYITNNPITTFLYNTFIIKIRCIFSSLFVSNVTAKASYIGGKYQYTSPENKADIFGLLLVGGMVSGHQFGS